MSLHIDRKCMFCGKTNPNEIYMNWTEEAMEDKDLMREFYDEWKCNECKITQ